MRKLLCMFALVVTLPMVTGCMESKVQKESREKSDKLIDVLLKKMEGKTPSSEPAKPAAPLLDEHFVSIKKSIKEIKDEMKSGIDEFKKGLVPPPPVDPNAEKLKVLKQEEEEVRAMKAKEELDKFNSERIKKAKERLRYNSDEEKRLRRRVDAPHTADTAFLNGMLLAERSRIMSSASSGRTISLKDAEDTKNKVSELRKVVDSETMHRETTLRSHIQAMKELFEKEDE